MPQDTVAMALTKILVRYNSCNASELTFEQNEAPLHCSLPDCQYMIETFAGG